MKHGAHPRDIRSGELGFTAAYCGRDACACSTNGVDDGDVVEALRSTVRTCPHGVLVSVDCMVEGCERGATGPGRYVLVQPCDTRRRPVGEAVVAGPLHERDDVDQLCHWLRHGVDRPCPAHLRAGPFTAGPGGS